MFQTINQLLIIVPFSHSHPFPAFSTSKLCHQGRVCHVEVWTLGTNCHAQPCTLGMSGSSFFQRQHATAPCSWDTSRNWTPKVRSQAKPQLGYGMIWDVQNCSKLGLKPNILVADRQIPHSRVHNGVYNNTNDTMSSYYIYIYTDTIPYFQTQVPGMFR